MLGFSKQSLKKTYPGFLLTKKLMKLLKTNTKGFSEKESIRAIIVLGIQQKDFQLKEQGDFFLTNTTMLHTFFK